MITGDDLPNGFAYPNEFIRVLNLGLTDVYPWFILEGDLLIRRAKGIARWYPNRKLVPFAMRRDNDDVACWDIDSDCSVVIIHDFADPGYEGREKFSDFTSWFHWAIDDMFAFE